MFAIFGAAIERRRNAVREAETLVAHFGQRGVEMANGFVEDPNVSAERREHFGRVSRHARRRHEFLKSLDTASRYIEISRVSFQTRSQGRGK